MRDGVWNNVVAGNVKNGRLEDRTRKQKKGQESLAVKMVRGRSRKTLIAVWNMTKENSTWRVHNLEHGDNIIEWMKEKLQEGMEQVLMEEHQKKSLVQAILVKHRLLEDDHRPSEVHDKHIRSKYFLVLRLPALQKIPVGRLRVVGNNSATCGVFLEKSKQSNCGAGYRRAEGVKGPMRTCSTARNVR